MRYSHFFFLVVLLVLTGCTKKSENEDALLNFENDLQNLQELKSQIEALAETSVCGPDYECLFIAFGTKACGGPHSYLIYSSSIDTLKLEKWVAEYNQKEKELNEKWAVVSDCAYVSPPSNITCDNGKCAAQF